MKVKNRDREMLKSSLATYFQSTEDYYDRVCSVVFKD